jgi:hypothetical protein
MLQFYVSIVSDVLEVYVAVELYGWCKSIMGDVTHIIIVFRDMLQLYLSSLHLLLHHAVGCRGIGMW